MLVIELSARWLSEIVRQYFGEVGYLGFGSLQAFD
jgi:hypothetical protein